MSKIQKYNQIMQGLGDAHASFMNEEKNQNQPTEVPQQNQLSQVFGQEGNQDIDGDFDNTKQYFLDDSKVDNKDLEIGFSNEVSEEDHNYDQMSIQQKQNKSNRAHSTSSKRNIVFGSTKRLRKQIQKKHRQIKPGSPRSQSFQQKTRRNFYQLIKTHTKKNLFYLKNIKGKLITRVQGLKQQVYINQHQQKHKRQYKQKQLKCINNFIKNGNSFSHQQLEILLKESYFCKFFNKLLYNRYFKRCFFIKRSSSSKANQLQHLRQRPQKFSYYDHCLKQLTQKLILKQLNVVKEQVRT